MAFIVDEKMAADNITNSIYQCSGLIKQVELFDEFKSDKFGKSKKNLAFHIYFQAADKTLKDNQVDEIIKEIIKLVEKAHKAKLRNR